MSATVKSGIHSQPFFYFKEALICQKSQWTPPFYPVFPEVADELILKLQKKWRIFWFPKNFCKISLRLCKFRPNGVRISLQAVWVFQFKRCGCFGWTVRTCVGCDTVFPAATAARKKHHFRCKTAQPSLASLRCAWMASVFLILIVVMQLTL